MSDTKEVLKKIETLELNPSEKDRIHLLSKKLLNVPYKYGAEIDLKVNPDEVKEIDCSELVQYIFFKIGYNVADGSYYQFHDSLAVLEENIAVGDLVFKQKDGKICHVGLVMAINPSVVVEAEGWYGKVVLTPFENFSNPKPNAAHFAGIRRFRNKDLMIV